MGHPVWTFTRGGDILTIRRKRARDGLCLVVDDSGATHTHYFDDIAPLAVFQAELEAMLVRNGWSFAAFSAEEREHRLFDHAGVAARTAGELDRDVGGRRKY